MESNIKWRVNPDWNLVGEIAPGDVITLEPKLDSPCHVLAEVIGIEGGFLGVKITGMNEPGGGPMTTPLEGPLAVGQTRRVRRDLVFAVRKPESSR